MDSNENSEEKSFLSLVHCQLSIISIHAIQTNSQAGSVCWSLKMQSLGTAAGAGNILLGDGSAQQVTSACFRRNWLCNANPTTNWPVGHVPSSPSIRVLFP
jgi:hypothetical protein